MNEAERHTPLPMKWEYAKKVYDAMYSDKKLLETESGELIDIWVGFTTRLFTDLGVPVPYYGDILHILKEMGCIEQMRRGGRTTQSIWVLMKQPDPDDYVRVRPPSQGVKRRKEVQHLEQQMADVRNLFKGVDVPKALADLQSTVTEVKTRLDKVEEKLAQE